MKFSRLIFIVCFAVLCLSAGMRDAQALSVDNVRFGVHADKTRLVLDLNSTTDFRAFTLENPYRLVVDLQNFDWHAGSAEGMKQAGVTDLRHGSLQPGVSRIVFDLSMPVAIRTAFIIPPQQGKPYRLVIDFSAVNQTQFRAAQATVHGTLSPGSSQPSGPGTAVTAPLPTPAAQPKKKPLIVLDPGHGGVDPGAIAKSGAREKDIVLKLAKELRDELEATGMYRVILTRETDIFIKLSDRVKFARQHEADLFVSIHADSINKSNVKGVSIYTLSEKSSDEQTEKLAARENQADLIAGIDLSTEDEDVANILIDLSMRDTMNQSKYFANKLVTIMDSGGVVLLESPHRYAGFAVLKAPDIPSILVEAGFLSNPKEADLLNTRDYRKKIVGAMKDGIHAYFEQARKNQRI